MAEKFYSIGTHTSKQYTDIRKELIEEGSGRSSIPSRKVENTDEVKHSKTRGEFKLTEEEATLLKNDSNIKYIMLSMDKYPELYEIPAKDDPSIWETVSIGSGNGLNKKSFINQTFDEPGIYEYFILASNKTTLKTVFKGTTVTVT